MELVIFSRIAPCPYCDAAKQLFKEHNLQYTEIKCDLNAGTKKLFKEKAPDAKTVPQIFLNDEHLGGYTETKDQIFAIIKRMNRDDNA